MRAAPLLTAQISCFLLTQSSFAFSPAASLRRPSALDLGQGSSSALHAAPKRYEENVEGPLFVNEKCINCGACHMFAPDSFDRSPSDRYHVVHKQPETTLEITNARAALSACPVAAIRVETKAHRQHANNNEPMMMIHEDLPKQLAINPKFNGLELPFPRPLSAIPPTRKTKEQQQLLLPETTNNKEEDSEDIYMVGHHNSASFGAAPYLVRTDAYGWILVDSPKYSPSAVKAIDRLTGGDGPSHMFLTHVDDTADHGRWKEEYPSMKRIFHEDDLWENNWLNDHSLEKAEVLLKRRPKEDATSSTSSNDSNDGLSLYRLDGSMISHQEAQREEIVIVHTPGHSPGSICLWKLRSSSSSSSPGVLFTGDTYAYTNRDQGRMTGFPRYGNNQELQSRVLSQLLDLEWEIIAPGHGGVRDYSSSTDPDALRRAEMQGAIAELEGWGRR